MTHALSPAHLLHTLRRHPPAPRYWIAYSGGLDSHVLLHLCAQLLWQFPEMNFRAVHVHHGLQAGADRWGEHCAETCRDLAMPHLELRVDARPGPGESPEEAARRARYAAIGQHMQAGDMVLAAQHRDDQAETVLLQLLRGAGLAGLAAMPELAALPPGWLLRPLLGFAREELRQYAQAHELRWIEDPSNQDAAYDRNFLRNDIIPRLEQRWPGLKKALGRTAGHCAEAQRQLADLAADLLGAALHPDGASLGVAALRGFKPADQRLVLRAWLRARGFRMPSQAVIERILQEALPARQDKTPVVAWREGEVRRYRDALYLLPPLPAFDARAVLDWDGATLLTLPGGNGTLAATPTALPGIAAAHWRPGHIQVRHRLGGEHCRLPGRTGNHELKKLFQERGVAPWLRERVPLVFIDGELAAVGGWWVCAPFAGAAGGDNIALSWRGGPVGG
ncbi:MAG: tRNA lysidine(34) synthetase TilS [Candidatus Methylumidiphilus sp.]